ncbi:GbsR/MarR family transcriptional regulator [Pseudalkalibacillus caeni]|uniref:HTH-type transcriptional regulator n=1 Tax=Exobacillus caeni TaxID=2574798 RepID=A0A5R9F4N9_9BACL|nr:GbsR/MarR family transcriptional regulator [Pseudalkalibacillus caeni]TLS38672.1 GbsR/MarR family transcriptional regulator [Pseudalkalibacillus caeni]
MNPKFKEARERIIDQNSESQTLFSLQPTVKRLMSVMYYYEKPMTLDDMKDILGMSKASMSNAVRELDDIGLVEKVWKKGERKDLYKVEEDNYESFIKYFCYHWRKIIVPKTHSLKKSINELNELKLDDEMDEETKELIDKDLEKLHEGLEYLEWVGNLVELFESHKIFDHIPKKPSKLEV